MVGGWKLPLLLLLVLVLLLQLLLLLLLVLVIGRGPPILVIHTVDVVQAGLFLSLRFAPLSGPSEQWARRGFLFPWPCVFRRDCGG